MKLEFLEKRAGFIVAFLLIALTLVAFWPVFRHDFIGYDDEQYIGGNPRVQMGINAESIHWAFTSFYASNWHPLTWITHMVDYRLFGARPAGHHAVNLLLHTANTLLLCFVLRRMTKSLWRSAFVAALFAVHPMHVESVAWVAERKDVLSTFFWLLTMWAYTRYAERPGVKWYALVVLFLGLGMLSKPTVVTLPFVLLLLDYWPLGRLSFGKQESAGAKWRLVREKLPLFLMAAASSAVTYAAQRAGGALVTSSDQLRLGVRVGNALLAYVTYIGRMFWPHDLAIFYPHLRTQIPEWQTVGSFVILSCITILALGFRRARPYLAVGWLWYLGTLVPMVGLVQVGQAAMADRYTYISYIGLFVMISWGISESVGVWECGSVGDSGSPPRPLAPSPLLIAMAIVVIVALVVCTRVQLRYWRDGLTLFSHAIAVTKDNDLAHIHVGMNLAERGKLSEATAHYQEALRINPYADRAHNNLGNVYLGQGKFDAAMSEYESALELRPSNPAVHFNIGVLLGRRNRLADAVVAYRRALDIKPDYPEVRANLAQILERQGKMDEAIACFSDGVRLFPSDAHVRHQLGLKLAKAGRLDEAMIQYKEAVRLKPDWPEAHYNYGNALARRGRADDAIAEYRAAVKYRPRYADALFNLGVLLDGRDDAEGAMKEYRATIKVKPDHGEAHANLAIDLFMKGDYAQAWKEVRLAQRYKCSPDPDFLKALAAKMPQQK